MRPIIKSPEPATLSAYRQTRGASFDGLPSPAKQDLKEQLLLEQGHLCLPSPPPRLPRPRLSDA